MCTNNSDIFSCLNDGQCSLNGTCICASACFVGNFCEINYNAAHLPLTGAIVQDFRSTRNIYIFIFVLFGFVGLVNNLLALITFMRGQIRVTVCGIYLILFSILSILLMITLLTYILTIVRYNNETYQLLACRFLPFIYLIMLDGSILFTAAIAVERVLAECLNFRFNGSRKHGVVISIIIILYVAGTNIDEIFTRRISKDFTGDEICIYDFDGHPTWRSFDVVFSYAHVIIPCTVHLICTLCALTTIARRKIFVLGTEHRFCHIWLRELYVRQSLLIPPICLIVCILPHGILGHLLQTCIPYSDKFKLRLHISFVLLMFAPQMLSFILYVYPNDIYWKEFQETIIYRKFCCYCYHKQQTLRQQKDMHLQWKQRRTSLYTIEEESIATEPTIDNS